MLGHHPVPLPTSRASTGSRAASRTDTCPVFLVSRRTPLKRRRFCGGACGLKLVRSSSAHERPTSLGAVLADGVEYRGHQCALQLADRSGSARDRRRRTAGASLSRRGCGRRGLCDGVLGGVGLRPANGRGAGVCPIGAHGAAVPRALCAGRDGGAQSRRGLASRSTTYLRETFAQHRDAEKPGDEQPAKSTGDDADRATPSAKDRAAQSTAIRIPPRLAPVDDGEPVPMSLDRNASDRTFDRQLAHLGLLDDAAPLFREGGPSISRNETRLRSADSSGSTERRK